MENSNLEQEIIAGKIVVEAMLDTVNFYIKLRNEHATVDKPDLYLKELQDAKKQHKKAYEILKSKILEFVNKHGTKYDGI